MSAQRATFPWRNCAISSGKSREDALHLIDYRWVMGSLYSCNFHQTLLEIKPCPLHGAECKRHLDYSVHVNARDSYGRVTRTPS